MKKNDFIHLHVHSHYSLLDGLGKIPELLEKTKKLGMDSIALTDHGVMYGIIEFYKEAKKQGIKPIIGCEVYIAPRKLTDKNPSIDTKPYHLTLLSKNEEGYKNLLKLSTIAHLKGYYYKPRVDKEVLKKHSSDLIALSGCLQGEVPRLILSGKIETAKKTIGEYQKIFGEKNFYLELQDHGKDEDQEVANKKMKELSKELGVPLVATNDVHYVNSEDTRAHDILLCIQTGTTVDEKNRMKYEGDFSLRDPKDMEKIFSDVPEAIENTNRIAKQCDVEIKFDQDLLPHFPLPKGNTEDEYLEKLCRKGLKERFSKISPEIEKRLKYELDTIRKMGFSSYFLIVADFVNFAKDQNILVGPGRGSATGCLVSYLLKVTDLNPLKYGLLFERFLNPDRISMPDIDMDFADDRRNEVIDYIVKKYGKEKVAGIITFGTMAARAAVRDTGRALGMPYLAVDRVAKLVPPPIQGKHIHLASSVEKDPSLKAVYKEEPDTQKLLDQASKLEGTVRHASQHACAVVISKELLTDYTALQPAQGGDIDVITQYSMYPIEDIGLLKMDLLGLANLSIMGRAVEIIEAVHGDKVDIHNLPLDDKKTYELFGRAKTTGVFQLESAGMKRYIKELRPNRFEDIIAMLALYRPGPMQFIPNYIRRKHGKEKISYKHPLMKNALIATYGVIVYQEQVMQISRDMASFTGGESDTLRKAMGKKIAKLMKQMKNKFVEGCVKNKVKRKVAEEVFSSLEEFSAYGFNKSHAAGYAMIAYQTAYLKAHYPECFMAALLTSDYSNIDRITIEVEECNRMGLEVLPPDVNESFQSFAVVKGTNKIRFGLAAIKNIGMGVADKIVKERKKNGAYKSLEEFIKRSGSEAINKKSLESLIKVGALERFTERNKLLFNIDVILKFAQSFYKDRAPGQIELFGEKTSEIMPKLKLTDVEEISTKQKLAFEKELLGIYLSEHPLSPLRDELAKNADQIIKLKEMPDNNQVSIGAIITKTKKITTRNGQPMIFATVEDLTGSCEILVFPKILEKSSRFWNVDNLIFIRGKVSDKEGEPKILVNDVMELTKENLEKNHTSNNKITQENQPASPFLAGRQAASGHKAGPPRAESLHLKIPKNFKKLELEKIKKVILEYPGDKKVVLQIRADGKIKTLNLKNKVNLKKEFLDKISYIVGEDNLKVE